MTPTKSIDIITMGVSDPLMELSTDGRAIFGSRSLRDQTDSLDIWSTWAHLIVSQTRAISSSHRLIVVIRIKFIGEVVGGGSEELIRRIHNYCWLRLMPHFGHKSPKMNIQQGVGYLILFWWCVSLFGLDGQLALNSSFDGQIYCDRLVSSQAQPSSSLPKGQGMEV